MKTDRIRAEVGDVVQFTMRDRRNPGPTTETAVITEALGELANSRLDVRDLRSYYFRVRVENSDLRLTLRRSEFHIVRKWNAPELSE